jgi:dTDP-4-dehydrorhamnose reductase
VPTRLLVTGGTGYLGSELVRRSGATGISSRDADVRDPAAVKRVVAGHEAVVHTAYLQAPPEAAWSVNVEGSRNVARAAYNAGARLVHLSTDVVFDGLLGRPYVEGDPVSPVTDYGRAKAAAEDAVRSEHPRALVVRTSLIYGGDPPSRHAVVARDPSMTFYEDEVRCPIELGDLSNALLELVADDAEGILHVAGAEGVSRCEFARLVARTDVRCAPAPPGRPLDCRLDSSRAQAQLTTRLRGVREVFE